MNVITNVIPIDLHFKLKLATKHSQILAKDPLINETYRKWETGVNRGKGISTMCRVWMASKQILKSSHKNLRIFSSNVYDERLPTFISSTKMIPAANTKEEQQELVNNLIEVEKFDYIITTDGSTIKEKWESCGMSGAAAVVHKEKISIPAIAKLVVCFGSESNNYVAELKGINIGLKYLEGVTDPGRVLLLCDCKPALESCFSHFATKDYRHIITENRIRLQNLENRGIDIKAAWVPGHSNFEPNEEADELAKAAARKCRLPLYPCERKEIKNKLKEMVLKNWQDRVNSVMSNQKAQGVRVTKWFAPRIDNLHWMWQLASGKNKLNKFMNKIDPDISPRCLCGEIEDADHFLLSCERYSQLRFNLMMEINYN